MVYLNNEENEIMERKVEESGESIVCFFERELGKITVQDKGKIIRQYRKRHDLLIERYLHITLKDYKYEYSNVNIELIKDIGFSKCIRYIILK